MAYPALQAVLLQQQQQQQQQQQFYGEYQQCTMAPPATTLQYLQQQQQAAALLLQPQLQQLPPGLQSQQQQLQHLEAPISRRPTEPGFWERVMSDLLSYQEENTKALEAAHAAAAGMTPAAKGPSTAPVEGPLTPDRGALLEGDKQALDQLLGLLKERQMQLGDGFWQKTWHQLQRYLNSAELGEQPGASTGAGAGAAAAGSPAGATSERLPLAEQIALRSILEPIRKDQIATLQRRLQELGAGLDGTAGLQGAGGTAGGLDGAAAAAAGAAGDGMMMQGVNGGALESMMNNFLYGGGGDGDEGAYQVQVGCNFLYSRSSVRS